jgi:hypothetical protein
MGDTFPRYPEGLRPGKVCIFIRGHRHGCLYRTQNMKDED